VRNKPFRFAMGDVNYLDYGGTWFRHLSGKRIGETHRYHFIRLINWSDACGSDAPSERYNVSLSEVNLDQLTAENIASALSNCGNASETDSKWRALACLEYGLHAPLLDQNGNNFASLYRQCASESTRVELDARYRHERLNRPVNALGSTASEFMRGDIYSALERGVKAGDKPALIIAKMYDACAKREGDK